MTTYTTRRDAIDSLILPALTLDGHDDTSSYDVDAIADAVLGVHAQGYAQQVHGPAFWDAVAAAHLDATPERAAWIDAHGATDTLPGGDVCGCPDPRCIGHHHPVDAEVWGCVQSPRADR
ncbi:hypothetical protein [Brachybacterium squillarum]|uniref:hypothetical protein n=1 Tax=Brachybacterium squillarum TaxID=661979 RepID=UPI0002D43F74|nr:hypothetical protein [Brachybacterium squillarum]